MPEINLYDEISNEGGKLKFLYDYKTYEVEGDLAQAYKGIGDIHIDSSFS